MFYDTLYDTYFISSKNAHNVYPGLFFKPLIIFFDTLYSHSFFLKKILNKMIKSISEIFFILQ